MVEHSSCKRLIQELHTVWRGLALARRSGIDADGDGVLLMSARWKAAPVFMTTRPGADKNNIYLTADLRGFYGF